MNSLADISRVCLCFGRVDSSSLMNIYSLSFVIPAGFKIQVWFQNQRAKVKKIQKKQLKEGTKSKEESQEDSENEAASKLSVKVKSENSSE